MKKHLSLFTTFLLLLCGFAKAQQNRVHHAGTIGQGSHKTQKRNMARAASQTNVKFGVKSGGSGGGGGAQRSAGGKGSGKGHVKRSCIPGSGICEESTSRSGGYTPITWGWDNNSSVLSMTLDTNILSQNNSTEDAYFQTSSSTYPSVPWDQDYTLGDETWNQIGVAGSGVIIPANCTDTLRFTGPNSAVLSFYNVIDVESAYVILGQPGQLSSSGIYGIFNGNLPQFIYGSETSVTPVYAKFEFKKLSTGTTTTYKVTMVVSYSDLITNQPWVQQWLQTGASSFQIPVAGFPFSYMRPFMVSTANLFLPSGAYPQSVDANNNIRVEFTASYKPVEVPGAGTTASLMGGQTDQLIPVYTGSNVNWHFGSLWSNGCDPNQGGLCYLSQNSADFPVTAQVYYDDAGDAANYDNFLVLVNFDTLSLRKYNQANRITNNATTNFVNLIAGQYAHGWINPGSTLIKNAIPAFTDTFGLQCAGVDTIGFYNPDGTYNIMVSLLFWHWTSSQYAPNVSSGDVATMAREFIKKSAIKRKTKKAGVKNKMIPKKK